ADALETRFKEATLRYEHDGGSVRAGDLDACFKEAGDVAIAACTRLIASGKFSGKELNATYYNRGIPWYDKGHIDRPIEDYDRAIELNPRFEQAIFNRGNAYDAKGQYDSAIHDYNWAIKLDPNYAKAFNNRGFVWDEKREYERAIQDYDRAIAIDPTY